MLLFRLSGEFPLRRAWNLVSWRDSSGFSTSGVQAVRRFDRLDIACVDVIERKDQVVAAKCDFALSEQHHFLAAHLAVQESRGDDRDEERGSLDRLVDLFQPVRPARNEFHIPQDIHLWAPDQKLQLTFQPQANAGQFAIGTLVVGAGIAPEPDQPFRFRNGRRSPRPSDPSPTFP